MTSRYGWTRGKATTRCWMGIGGYCSLILQNSESYSSGEEEAPSTSHVMPDPELSSTSDMRTRSQSVQQVRNHQPRRGPCSLEGGS
ncbi:hypothetical protein FKM82_018859 [Ascaphus truei]